MNWPVAEFVSGVIVLVPSVGYLIWVRTDPNAGYLMIVGALLAVLAFGGAIAGAALVGGGAWRLANASDAGIGRALGAVAGVLIGGLAWPRSRRRRR